MDLDSGLSFVPAWLQSSLQKVKFEYGQGMAHLQMPFCVLETNYDIASARANALQQRNPFQKVGIATLDIVPLKRAKIVASAEHTFDFLRVSKEETIFESRLLAWAEGDDGRATKALQDAVLTIVEWEGKVKNTGMESPASASNVVGEGAASHIDVSEAG